MDKYNNSKCAIYLVIDEALAGTSEDYSPGSTWIGSAGVQELGNSALNLINDNQEALGNIGNTEITDNFQGTKEFLQNLYDKFDNEDVVDPTKASGTLVLDMFKKNNGKYPFIEVLEEEVEKFEGDITTKMKELVEGAAEASNGQTILEARDALESVNDFDKEINEYKNNIYDYVDDAKKGFKYTRLGTCIYFALVIGSVGVIFLGSVPVMVCESKCCRCVSNLGCVLLAIFMTLGFLVTAVLFPLSVVIIEGCDLIELDQLKKDRGIIPESAWDEIGICINGDGDLYTDKGLKDSLTFAGQSVDGLTYTTLFYDKDEEKMKYPAAENLIEELDRIAKEAPYEASKSTFPGGRLDLGSIPLGDTIVWSGCTPKPEITNEYLSTVGGICLPIVDCKEENKADIAERYKDSTEFRDKLLKYIDYAIAVKDKVDLLKADIDREAADTYMKRMDKDTEDANIHAVMAEANRMDNLDETIEKMDVLSNELRIGLDCKFMQNSFERLHSSFCGAFTQQITFTALILGIISAISLLLLIAMVCINRYFYAPKIPGRAYLKPNASEPSVSNQTKSEREKI